MYLGFARVLSDFFGMRKTTCVTIIRIRRSQDAREEREPLRLVVYQESEESGGGQQHHNEVLLAEMKRETLRRGISVGLELL